ncbi:MAG: anti-sigma factor [Verrucomicrobiota bacterium]
MDDSLPENAALYALGLLTGDELAAFERALRENPALAAEVRAMTEAALVLAKTAPQVAPPTDLRAQLLAAFEAAPGDAPIPENVVPMTPATASPDLEQSAGSPPQAAPRLLHLIPWAAAAVLTVLFLQQKTESGKLSEETARLNAENVLVTERERHYLDAIRSSESAKEDTATALNAARSALEKAEARLTGLEGEHSTLLTELTALRQDSQLDKTRIAVLGSILKNAPKAVAVSLWRQETQQGLLVVENLPALPPGRDYQLWVIDPNHKSPVSAGVFKVDVDGKVRIEFKPVQPVREASKFAVTMEQEGGSPTPHLDQLVVIGG